MSEQKATTSLMHALPNPTCPLCGQPNDCAAARTGRLDIDCWCQQTPFNPASLALVPDAQRNQACLCRRCASAPPTRQES